MWVKICGITDLENAKRVVAAAPDAVGLNFYQKSPRGIQPDVAAAIVDLLPADIEPVGLFVNHPPQFIVETCLTTGIGTLQLHGEESADAVQEIARRIPDAKIIRAFRVGDDGLREMEGELESLRNLHVELHACLVDARVPGRYGGSGRCAPWEVLRDHDRVDEWPPLILAGGLNADNVAEAMDVVHPWGVDVAGGVESSPGVKDAAAVKRFVQAARNRSAL